MTQDLYVICSLHDGISINEPLIVTTLSEMFAEKEPAIEKIMALAQNECKKRNERNRFYEQYRVEAVCEDSVQVQLCGQGKANFKTPVVCTTFSTHKAEYIDKPSPVCNDITGYYSYREYIVCWDRKREVFTVCKDDCIYSLQYSLKSAFSYINELHDKIFGGAGDIDAVFSNYGRDVFLKALHCVMAIGTNNLSTHNIEMEFRRICSPKRIQENSVEVLRCSCEIAKFSPMQIAGFLIRLGKEGKK